MGLAGSVQKVESMQNTLLNAMDQGVTFIDTARAYGDSERIIGRLRGNGKAIGLYG